MKQTEIKMTYKKSTKNTHVYENTNEDAPVPTLYIRRNALEDKPATIKVVISDE